MPSRRPATSPIFGLNRLVSAIGEVKWGETVGVRHLLRLRHATELLRERNEIPESASPVLLLSSGAGFTEELRDEAARSGEVGLLTPADLYTGVRVSSSVTIR